MKHSYVLVLFIVALALVAAGALFYFFSVLPGEASKYYVDSISGNDSNSGKSPSSAWKSLEKVNKTTFEAGSRILFICDGVWEGELHPLGSGKEGKPIIVDMYGNGDKPLINGGGNTNAIRLADQSYWEINNLEITNDARLPDIRRGISIEETKNMTINHIHIKNTYIHNIKGNPNESGSKKCGGIVVWGCNSNGRNDENHLSRYNDILIEGNELYDLDRVGMNICEDTSLSHLSTKVTIRRNFIYNCGGDGIIVNMSDSPLIEHNTCAYANARSGETACAIWPWNCIHALFQYNEAYGTKTSSRGDDGTAWDCDGSCDGTIYQYNYSHDNKGGAFLICSDANNISSNSIIRYNVSVNDMGRVIYFCGPCQNTTICNNTFYIGSGVSNGKVIDVEENGGYAHNSKFYNNIFYNLAKDMSYYFSFTKPLFEHNLFFGNHPQSEPADEYKLTSDPILAGPDITESGFQSLDGFRLKSDSPCIDSGMNIADSGQQDFWGNSIPNGKLPDIGASEFIAGELKTPNGIQAKQINSSEIDIRWDSVSGVEYDIQIDGSSVVKSISSPYRHSNLAAGEEHIYRIRCRNGSQTGPWSLSAKAEIKNPVRTPKNITMDVISDSQINISWNSVPGATGYDILPDGGAIKQNSERSFIHTGLAPGSKHTYRIRAIKNGESSAWSEPVASQTASHNLVQNPGFETGDRSHWKNDLDGINSVVVEKNALTGRYSLATGVPSYVDAGCSQIMPSGDTTGKIFVFSAWVKCDSGITGAVGVDCFDNNGNKMMHFAKDLTFNEYTQIVYTFSPPEGTAYFQVFSYKSANEGNGAFYSDDFALIEEK